MQVINTSEITEAIIQMTSIMQMSSELECAMAELVNDGLAISIPAGFTEGLGGEIDAEGDELTAYACISLLTHLVMEKVGYTENGERADYIQAVYGSLLKSRFRIEKRKEIKKIPFFAIPFTQKTYEEFSLEKEKLQKNQLCFTGPVNTDGPISFDSIGIMDEDTRFPCLVDKNGTILYGTSPEVINITKPILDEVKGHVLSLGLGIGYFEYLASLKQDVEKITVVERSPELILIFKENVLPYIKHKEKLEIIQADPYTYMNRLKEAPDYCVVDIETDSDDIVDCYLIMKDHEKKKPETKFLYVDEETVLNELQLYVVKEIMTVSLGYETEIGKKKEKRITEKVGRIYHDKMIFRPADLESMIDMATIKNMLA